MSSKIKTIYENAFKEEMKEDFNYNKYKEDMVWFGTECQISLLLELVNNFKDKKDLTVKDFVKWGQTKINSLDSRNVE